MSKIEWLARPGTTPVSWNPVTGCTPCSDGCQHCYAKTMSRRLAGRYGYPVAPNHFDVTLHGNKLNIPLKWHKPRTVFVCSMGDLFHNHVPLHYIKDVWSIMASHQRHTFIVLTKRPERMEDFITTKWGPFVHTPLVKPVGSKFIEAVPNVWLGVTVENQKQAANRIPILAQIPAAIRFLSCEPLLEAINISFPIGPRDARYGIPALSKIDWVICGSETGPGKRYMNPAWARSIMEQCEGANTPFFFKKNSDGTRLLDGEQYNQWPER